MVELLLEAEADGPRCGRGRNDELDGGGEGELRGDRKGFDRGGRQPGRRLRRRRRNNLLYDAPAVIVENDEFAELLLANGAKADHVDDAGVTVLIQAAHRGMAGVVGLLLEREGDMSVESSSSEGSYIYSDN